MTERPDRRLTVIAASDIVGYSRLMSADEVGTLAAVRRHRSELFDPVIARHGGRVVKLMGDGALVEFVAVTDAVEAMIAIQRGLAEAGGPIRLRVGINLGDVIGDGEDIYGDGVNVAARLEAIAPSGGIAVSALVHQCLPGELAAEFAEAGLQRVKNIPHPVAVHSWPSGAILAAGEAGEIPRRAASVAALPFEELTAESAGPRLAAGISEDLTTELSQIDEVTLVTVPAEIASGGARAGRALGVDWLLRGAVRVAGARARANVQLVDCAADKTVWAKRFEGTTEDPFAFTDAVVDESVVTLQVMIADGDQALVWRAESGGGDAYQSFLAGRASYKQYRRSGIMRAREHYETALALNPDFPAALVGLARTHIEDVTWRWSTDREVSRRTAHELLDRALTIAPDHALAFSERAHLSMVEGAFEAGLDWATRATQRAPTLADAHHVRAVLLNCVGRYEEALHSLREAIGHAPAFPDFYLVAMADALLGLRRWADVAAVCRQILARRPDWLMSRAALAIALVGLGQRAEAEREAAIIRERSMRFTATTWRSLAYFPDRADMPELQSMLMTAGLTD